MAGEELSSTTDLLTHFGSAPCRGEAVEDAAGDIELGLGLSLGGCFGVKPRLVRSFSMVFPEDEDVVRPIVRTRSLPGDESMRTMEAKRRRLERMDFRSGGREVKAEVPVWAAVHHGGVGLGLVPQRSIGSQGSSGVVDLDCWHEQESSSSRDVVSPTIIPSSHTRAKNRPSTEEEKPSDKMNDITSQAKQVERNMMQEMPYVSTRGEGPNGKFIQGFLYKYGNGAEVRIVCVCHGSFLTPEEFVKHAGGDDVVHPLRHIVISRLPYS